MYCNSIENPMINRIVSKIRSELAILNAKEIVEKTMNLKNEELQSRSKLSHLVTGRILFTSIAFSTGARNIDIAAHLQRNKASICYFIKKGNDRSKFDSEYKKIEQNINFKQNNNMSIIEEIAAKAAATAVAEMTKLFVEQGIIKQPETKENAPDKTDSNNGIEEFLAHQKGEKKDLGGKELDIYSTSGKKAFKISPADQLK